MKALRTTQATGTWLWVTRPDYYLDEDGNEREDLDPAQTDSFEGWWSCHKDTRRGDLILMWRTMPKCDIGYLIQAESDAYSIADDPEAADSWDYGCDYRVIHKFGTPVTKKDLDAFPAFQEWRPYRGRFQRRAFRIDDAYWQRLMDLLIQKNPDFEKVLRGLEGSSPPVRVQLEEELERELRTDLSRLKKHGYDLELVGQQVICRDAGGRIDLLCQDRKTKQFVVIELKITRAGRNTYAQIKSYMGWVKREHSKGKPVLGLVISRGADNSFLSCLDDEDGIRQLNLEAAGFN